MQGIRAAHLPRGAQLLFTNDRLGGVIDRGPYHGVFSGHTQHHGHHGFCRGVVQWVGAMATRHQLGHPTHHGRQKIRCGSGDERGLRGAFIVRKPVVVDASLLEALAAAGSAQPSCVIQLGEHVVFVGPSALARVGALSATLPSGSDPANPLPRITGSIEVGQRICEYVGTDAHRRAVEDRLIGALTKSTDGFWSRHLNRPISTRISRVLCRFPITPNQITVVTALLGIASGFVFAAGGFWNTVAGALLFHAASVIDGIDGELARLKFKASKFGQWLDTVADTLCYVFGLGGAFIGASKAVGGGAVTLLGGLAITCATLTIVSLYVYMVRNRVGSLLDIRYGFEDAPDRTSRVIRAIQPMAKRDFIGVLAVALSLLGLMPLMFAHVAIITFIVLLLSVRAHAQAAANQPLTTTHLSPSR